MLESINNAVESERCVVMLHGYGANKQDLFGLQSLFSDAHVISFEGPIRLPGLPGGHAWFNLDFTPYGITYVEPEVFTALELLQKELVELKEKFKEIILLGFSQGSILTHGIMLGNPGLLKAAICLSGRFSESIFLEESKEAVSGLPIFISHGLWDEVIPIDSGRQIMSYYKDSKADCTIKEYEMGHEINPFCIEDLSRWYLSLT